MDSTYTLATKDTESTFNFPGNKKIEISFF